MSDEKIDVLAVMDAEIARAGGEVYEAGRRLVAAREAVAEVLKAADHLTAIGNREPEGEFDRRWARLRAALNRCARVRSS